MVEPEFEFESATRVRERQGTVRVTPHFDGAGGVMFLLEIPNDSLLQTGLSVTVKMWAGPIDAATPIPALGAPSAVRTAEVPFAEYAAGDGYDARKPPRYYGVTTRVMSGFDEVGGSSEVFEIPSGGNTGARRLAR